jgi:uncharacterized membrane protein YqiK
MLELQKFDPLQTQVSLMVEKLRELKVTSAETSMEAATFLRAITTLIKQCEDTRKSITVPLDDAKKKAMEYEKQVTAPLHEVKAILCNQQIAYEKILEAERQAQYRLEQEERRKRDDEVKAKLKLAQEEAEAKIKAAQEELEMTQMFSGEAAAKEAKEKAEAEAQAIKAQAHAEAQRIEFEAQKAHWDAKKEIATNKVEGIRRVWKYRIIDLNLVPENLKIVSIDDKAVKKLMANEVRSISGIEFYQEIGVTNR